MTKRSDCAALGLVLLGAAVPAGAQQQVLDVATLARIGTVDERFQSYNVEMLEVTGGRFWKPYGSTIDAAAPSSDTPTGMNPNLYEYRPPIDLADPRLRKLAAALAPAYVRVSGTWANSTYLADSAEPPAAAPAGFAGVLSRQQWKGVVDFARAVDARLVVSFATSAGTRDAAGVWTPAQARPFLAYTKELGGEIAAAEFMNEPNLASIGGAPKGYDAATYGRDFKVFRAFAREAAPSMRILGPGSVAETMSPNGIRPTTIVMLQTPDLLAATGSGVLDVFSYHHYGTVSKRCGGSMTADESLSEDWLGRTDATHAFYKPLRDQFEPGKPIWLTETADAACGGNPWAASFVDTFRYLDQLGRLAKQGVQVVAHNTLAASDYGMVDGHTLSPRPNYWGAVLWRKLMGATVLESGVPLRAGLHAYAHCLRGTRGGVALLLINNDKTAAQTVTLKAPAEKYTLSSSRPETAQVWLNGTELTWDGKADLPRLQGMPTKAGDVMLAPATITFLAVPQAGNGVCR